MRWLSGHPPVQRRSGFVETRRGWLAAHWPCTENYFNPRHPIFAVEVSELKALESEPYWHFRDGTRPLGEFFARFPHPPRGPVRVGVAHIARSVVPSSWAERVDYYEIVQRVEARSARPKWKTLYVVGAAQVPPSAERVWARARGQLGEHLSRVEKLQYGLVDAPREFRGRTIEWGEFASSRHDPRTLVVSAFDECEVYDSFSIHVAAAKGSRIARLSSVRNASQIDVPLSPFHGLRWIP